MNWLLTDGQVTPELDATLHMTGLAGVCGRVRLRFLTDAGDYLGSEASDPSCPPTNGYRAYPVEIDPYSSGDSGQVEAVVQTDTGPNGAWAGAGGTTVSIEE